MYRFREMHCPRNLKHLRESIKEGVESEWESMKSAFSDAAAKFKE